MFNLRPRSPFDPQEQQAQDPQQSPMTRPMVSMASVGAPEPMPPQAEPMPRIRPHDMMGGGPVRRLRPRRYMNRTPQEVGQWS